MYVCLYGDLYCERSIHKRIPSHHTRTKEEWKLFYPPPSGGLTHTHTRARAHIHARAQQRPLNVALRPAPTPPRPASPRPSPNIAHCVYEPVLPMYMGDKEEAPTRPDRDGELLHTLLVTLNGDPLTNVSMETPTLLLFLPHCPKTACVAAAAAAAPLAAPRRRPHLIQRRWRGGAGGGGGGAGGGGGDAGAYGARGERRAASS